VIDVSSDLPVSPPPPEDAEAAATNAARLERQTRHPRMRVNRARAVHGALYQEGRSVRAQPRLDHRQDQGVVRLGEAAAEEGFFATVCRGTGAGSGGRGGGRRRSGGARAPRCRQGARRCGGGARAPRCRQGARRPRQRWRQRAGESARQLRSGAAAGGRGSSGGAGFIERRRHGRGA
jgi:hypothetical protein